MDDYQAYKIYFATKLHFTQKKYDVFQNKGIIGLTREKFDKKNEAKWFRFLSSKFSNSKDFAQFCIAQVVYGSLDDLFDFDLATSNYKEWLKNKQRLTYLIKEEIESNDLDDLLTGLPPKILARTIGRKLHKETAVAINRYRPFISNALLEKSSYLLFADEALRIKKLDKFIKYDESVISKLFQL